jgi:hypothetical protein
MQAEEGRKAFRVQLSDEGHAQHFWALFAVYRTPAARHIDRCYAASRCAATRSARTGLASFRDRACIRKPRVLVVEARIADLAQRLHMLYFILRLHRMSHVMSAKRQCA